LLALVCAETRGRTLHCWLWRGVDASVGNHFHRPNAHAMNLFCVGLSHHTANVGTLERFGGSAELDCLLRNSGCAEAVLLATCNRVEVYGASESRVSTLDIARC